MRVISTCRIYLDIKIAKFCKMANAFINIFYAASSLNVLCFFKNHFPALCMPQCTCTCICYQIKPYIYLTFEISVKITLGTCNTLSFRYVK